jgi:hypothetical protein
LIDNQALTDLRDELRKVIAQLESERYGVCPREEAKPPSRPGGLFAGFDLAAVRTHVNERYPGDARLGQLLARHRRTSTMAWSAPRKSSRAIDGWPPSAN